LVLALALAPVSAGAAGYKVANGSFDVEEQQSWTPYYKASWSGDGHQHEQLLAEDDDLPSLPVAIPQRGGKVFLYTDVLTDGHETSIDAEGKKEPCSGVWNEEVRGGFTVKIKPAGQGKVQSSWEIPHGISSERCGTQFDQMPSPLVVKSTAGGEIGDRRLVLQTSGTRTKTRQDSIGKEVQTLKWKARVVLVQVNPPKQFLPPR
jgi:hypothetical protein